MKTLSQALSSFSDLFFRVFKKQKKNTAEIKWELLPEICHFHRIHGLNILARGSRYIFQYILDEPAPSMLRFYVFRLFRYPCMAHHVWSLEPCFWLYPIVYKLGKSISTHLYPFSHHIILINSLVQL